MTDLVKDITTDLARALGLPELCMQDSVRPLVPLQDVVAEVVRRLRVGHIGDPTIRGTLAGNVAADWRVEETPAGFVVQDGRGIRFAGVRDARWNREYADNLCAKLNGRTRDDT